MMKLETYERWIFEQIGVVRTLQAAVAEVRNMIAPQDERDAAVQMLQADIHEERLAHGRGHCRLFGTQRK